MTGPSSRISHDGSTGPASGGIIRFTCRFASTILVLAAMVSAAAGEEGQFAVGKTIPTTNYGWDFGRSTDQNNDKRPDGWRRYEGIGYPKYVGVAIAARNPARERQLRKLDTWIVQRWADLREHYPNLPLPPSIADAMADRYLRIDLDGGQVKLESPQLAASRMFQYRFSCRVMTQGLQHSAARAEFVFVNPQGEEIVAHSTPLIRGTTNWSPVAIDLVRPPVGAAAMMVRLIVQRSEDGLEDIRGTIGFDDIRISQYPQLRIATDRTLGVYETGRPILATAQILGLPAGASDVQFRLMDSDDREVRSKRLAVKYRPSSAGDATTTSVRSEVTWKLSNLDPGFYRITASLAEHHVATLATETTIAVIDRIIEGPPHGAFGWTLPSGNDGIRPKELATWLADLGVAWVKFPCWLAPEDRTRAEEVAMIFGKLQDAGIQTVGMLDVPPEDQISQYAVRGRRDLVAAQLFRDSEIWQPLLEPVMSRLTLKVRTWQLGADRDHSFMGRPRLRESVRQISAGLQGFGQPLDIAISWPWMEQQLPHEESSWQAVCRSSHPPLGADELDAFLELSNDSTRGEGPRTWVLLDPIQKDLYDRQARIRDLVLRMATVRSHRVQAAFVSDPRHPQQGLLGPGGRPGELLLPWRTTSRLIGNLRKVGSLKLRSGAENLVFVGDDRAVLMVWSAEPTEERIYLGQHAQTVDVWGKVTDLDSDLLGQQPVQRVKIGPVPQFIIGADPMLLAFRMSVQLEQDQLDSFLGQFQTLAVSFTNPTRESLVGDMRVLPPESWSIENPTRSWEALARRTTSHDFQVVLSNTAKIGRYEFPVQFQIETVPPKRITVYRNVNVGPRGIRLNVTTRLLPSDELRVAIEITNNSERTQSYDCMLFPPPGRQYQRKFVTIRPGDTIRQEVYWPRGNELVGKPMLLRAAEQDGRRVLNFPIRVTR